RARRACRPPQGRVSVTLDQLVVNNKSNSLSNWRNFSRVSAAPRRNREDLVLLTEVARRGSNDGPLGDDKLPAGLERQPDVLLGHEVQRLFTCSGLDDRNLRTGGRRLRPESTGTEKRVDPPGERVGTDPRGDWFF